MFSRGTRALSGRGAHGQVWVQCMPTVRQRSALLRGVSTPPSPRPPRFGPQPSIFTEFGAHPGLHVFLSVTSGDSAGAAFVSGPLCTPKCLECGFYLKPRRGDAAVGTFCALRLPGPSRPGAEVTCSRPSHGPGPADTGRSPTAGDATPTSLFTGGRSRCHTASSASEDTS